MFKVGVSGYNGVEALNIPDPVCFELPLIFEIKTILIHRCSFVCKKPEAVKVAEVAKCRVV